MVVSREGSRGRGGSRGRIGSRGRGGRLTGGGSGGRPTGGVGGDRVTAGGGVKPKGASGANAKAGGASTAKVGGGVKAKFAHCANAKACGASTSHAPPPHNSGEGTARDGSLGKEPAAVEDGSTSRSQRHNAGDVTARKSGGTPLQRPRSSGNGGSSQCSNPQGRTPDSQATISVSRTTSIPPQYRASTNRLPFAGLTSQAPSNHQLPSLNFNRQPRQEAHQFDQPEDGVDNEDEEDDEDEGEEIDGEEHEAEELEGYHLLVGLDDQQLLDNILALPGRQRLPLLSEVLMPDMLW